MATPSRAPRVGPEGCSDCHREAVSAAANKGKTFYGEETLGDKKYFTAVSADTAIADACVTCHNGHKDSPRRDFKLGDVMGGVVSRVPLEG